MTKGLVATSCPSRIALQLRITHYSLTHALTHSVNGGDSSLSLTHADNSLSLILNTTAYLRRHICIHSPATPTRIQLLSSGSAHLRRRYAVHRLHLAVIPCNFLDLTKAAGATSAPVATSPSIFARHAFIHTAPTSLARRHRLFAHSRNHSHLARRHPARSGLHCPRPELGWH